MTKVWKSKIHVANPYLDKQVIEYVGNIAWLLENILYQGICLAYQFLLGNELFSFSKYLTTFSYQEYILLLFLPIAHLWLNMPLLLYICTKVSNHFSFA